LVCIFLLSYYYNLEFIIYVKDKNRKKKVLQNLLSYYYNLEFIIYVKDKNRKKKKFYKNFKYKIF